MNSNDHLQLMKFVQANSINRTQNLLNESAVSDLSDAVLDRMFTLTIGKYNKIDFSDIERTRGDITRFKHYNNLKECIDILMDLHTSTGKLPGALTVSIALENVTEMKGSFERAFRVKNNIAIVIYNTYVYAIMEATSYLISTSVDFVKSEKDEDYTVNIYTDSKNGLLIEQLVKLNKCVEDGSLLKFFMETEKEYVEPQVVTESTVGEMLFSFGKDKAKQVATQLSGKKKLIAAGAIAVAAIFLAINIVPIIREILYWTYRCKQRISDAAAMQAEFLETNVTILRSNHENDKIISRQEKHIKRFKALARTFSIESDKAERDAKKDINDDKVDVSAIVI